MDDTIVALDIRWPVATLWGTLRLKSNNGVIQPGLAELSLVSQRTSLKSLLVAGNLINGTFPSITWVDKHAQNDGSPITADVLKYHVIDGKVPFDQITGDQKTLQGSSLTYKRQFR